MIQRFINWLGTRRAWSLFLLLAITGLLSLMLQAVGTDVPWVLPVQNLLFLIALIGSLVLILARLDPLDRRPLLISVVPALAGLGLGILLPDFMLWFLGAGFGWMIASQVILRRNVRREYQQAIRHLRRNEYDQAIEIMDGLVKAEPDNSGHRRFRGDLYRLKGDAARALKDYRKITQIEPQSGVGYNGLAEIYLQQGDYDEALPWAQKAYEVEPDQWVMPYNLAMIEDRLGLAEPVITHLDDALRVGKPDVRHQVLIQLWLARAYARLGRVADVEARCAAIRGLKRGLREWQTIFESDQAEALRQVLAADIGLAQQIVDGQCAAVFEAVADQTEAST